MADQQELLGGPPPEPDEEGWVVENIVSRLTLVQMRRRRLSSRRPKIANTAHGRPRSHRSQKVSQHAHGPFPPCVPLSHSVPCVALPLAAAVFNDTLPLLEAAWTPPVFAPTNEETEARRRLAERCKACGLDVLLPFVPLVERSLLRDRQPLQPLRGVGGRMVLVTSRGARAHGR